MYHIADKKHVFLLASGLTFNTLLVIMPAVLVSFFVIGIVVDAHQASAILTAYIRQILPPSTFTEQVVFVIQEEVYSALLNSTQIGWLGIPILVWTASTLFSSLRTILNSLFEIPVTSSLVRQTARDLLTLALFAVFVSAANLSSVAQSIASAIHQNLWTNVALPPALTDFFAFFSSFFSVVLSSITFFAFVFGLVPNQRLSKQTFLLSTLTASGLWIAARSLFGWYISSTSSYGKIYGVYAIVVVEILWLYYSALILLLSAVFARYVEEKRLLL